MFCSFALVAQMRRHDGIANRQFRLNSPPLKRDILMEHNATVYVRETSLVLTNPSVELSMTNYSQLVIKYFLLELSNPSLEITDPSSRLINAILGLPTLLRTN